MSQPPAAPLRPARFWAAAWAFVRLQLSAAAFGASLLALIVASRLWYPEDAWLYRYDALLIAALAIQAFLLAAGWETWEEAKVILAFHVVGVAMEIFKTWAGAWVYPEPAVMRIEGVPLFTGFMYSAVGSYIARSWRILEMRFDRYPSVAETAALAFAIYANFYTHHLDWPLLAALLFTGAVSALLWRAPSLTVSERALAIAAVAGNLAYNIAIADWDWRYALFAMTGLFFWRTVADARLGPVTARVSPVILFFGVGVLIWIAENISTWANVWIYPTQADGWRMVPLQKLGSWYLLMIVSFVLVSLIHRPDRAREAVAEAA